MAHATPASLERKVGELLMVGFPGKRPGARGVEAVRREVAAGRVGGVILFRANIGSLSDVAALTGALQQAAPTPLFIAVDQEGGRVQRLRARDGFPGTPSAAAVAARTTPAGARGVYRPMAQGLSDLGINVNFGPVADLNTYRNNPIIGRLGRSFGADPGQVAAYAGAFVDAHREFGVATALKHFPGHGSSRGDTHKGSVDVSRTWQEAELTPFKALADAGRADMVMVAHVSLRRPGVADSAGPASLSSAVVDGLLRQRLGYDGVVVSDDMDMDAVRNVTGRRAGAVAALLAGVDLQIYSDHRGDPAGLIADLRSALLSAAARDPRVARRIEEAHRRITALKSRMGATAFATAALPGWRAPVPRPAPRGPADPIAAKLAAAAQATEGLPALVLPPRRP